eukprot:CCRYP_015754-RA/>CCRYP_015754-RA protein AED:0.44 eAED:1.00 QI:0/0/0/1/1/1/2/0/223
MYAPPFTCASKWGLTRASPMWRRLLKQPSLTQRLRRRSIHSCVTLRKKKGNKGDAPGTTAEAVPPALAEAKALYDKALKALEAAKLAVTMAGAKPFELYGNLLFNKAPQPWEKIQGPSDSCSLGRHQGSTAHRDSHKDLGLIPRLNSYLETLPCLYYSPKANQATKKELPLDDANLATHLLRMCPAKWQTQYDLTENTTPVSTRALLLVLENIENNAELDKGG